MQHSGRDFNVSFYLWRQQHKKDANDEENKTVCVLFFISMVTTCYIYATLWHVVWWPKTLVKSLVMFWVFWLLRIIFTIIYVWYHQITTWCTWWASPLSTTIFSYRLCTTPHSCDVLYGHAMCSCHQMFCLTTEPWGHIMGSISDSLVFFCV
jgi:hypothetical protein